ncbi:MAG: hypothetical protein KDD82_18085, partial [Planctomycetes bacterium]|nr:hypothetical protein [Planctomycetota bacterium]
ELRRLPSDAAYREARAAVLQRAVLEYPSAGRVLRDVPPGAPQRAEAEQLLAYLLAHGVTHCQDLYREGKADSALLLGRQLLELAEGSPLREGFAEELAQWAQVLDAFTRAADEGPGSPRSLEAWNEVLQLERSFDNYYSRRARRALAEIASLSEGAPPAKPDEAPAPLAPSPRLAHVAAGQRWVFRGQGGAETEWEVVRVEGDAVVYRETAHLPGRAMVEPASEKRWTPAELNLGRAQGGGVELRGPQALDVPGVTLRYTVRKVGEVEHWIAVDLLDQPTFPGIVRDARENGVALELVRVEQR